MTTMRVVGECFFWYRLTRVFSKRLYFLKQLKRAGVPADQLLHFYVAVICPVLEYSAPLWYHDISHLHAQQLVYTKTCHLYYIPFTRGLSYPYVLFAAELTLLEARRDQFSREFFPDICDSSSSIHHLLPPLTTPLLSQLRAAATFRI